MRILPPTANGVEEVGELTGAMAGENEYANEVESIVIVIG